MRIDIKKKQESTVSIYDEELTWYKKSCVKLSTQLSFHSRSNLRVFVIRFAIDYFPYFDFTSSIHPMLRR